MFRYYNPNPLKKSVGDCAVRAVAKALDTDWMTACVKLCMKAMELCDMPSADCVWGAVLHQNGFKRESLPNLCPDCYTAEMFCRDNPHGTFVLGFGGHVATVYNGDLYDSWDSSNEIPVYVWFRKDE